jgi:hypothetical protein
MSERQTIEIKVCESSLPDDDHVTVLIDWLQTKLSEIAEEFRASATFKIYDTTDCEYDMEISITYDRPETDEEMSKRIACEERTKELNREAAARWAEMQRTQEENRRAIELKALDRLLGLHPEYARERLQSPKR